MSTQCRFCGEAVRPDSMFCPACGQIIGMPTSAVPPFPGAARVTAEPTPGTPRAADPLPPVPLPAPIAVEQAEQPAPADHPPVVQQPRPEPQQPATPTSVALPSGQQLALDRVLVFGRSPESGAAAHKGTPVQLDDPERAMSRVHLVLAPASVGVIATDPGSANGTLLERGGRQYTLVAGTPSALEPGDRLLLGDAVLLLS